MSIKHNLIAVSGKKGSGKNEAAEMLQYCLSVPKFLRNYKIYKTFGKIIPKSWKIIAFADPLKQMLAVLLNIPVEKFNDRAFKEDTCINFNTLDYSLSAFTKDIHLLSDSKFTKMAKDLNPEIIQYDLTIRQLLQYFGTEICQTYFGKSVWINSTLKHAGNKTIISDCRFINEAKAIKSNNGIIVYIDRDGIPFGQHQSEKEMYKMLQKGTYYDCIIKNNGSLEDLFNSIKIFVTHNENWSRTNNRREEKTDK